MTAPETTEAAPDVALLDALRSGSAAAVLADDQLTDTERRRVERFDELIEACAGCPPVPSGDEWADVSTGALKAWADQAASDLADRDTSTGRAVLRDPMMMILELHSLSGGDPEGWVWGPLGPPQRGAAVDGQTLVDAHSAALGLAWDDVAKTRAAAEVGALEERLLLRLTENAVDLLDAVVAVEELMKRFWEWLAAAASDGTDFAALSGDGIEIAQQARGLAHGLAWLAARDSAESVFGADHDDYAEIGAAAVNALSSFFGLAHFWDARMTATNPRWDQPDGFFAAGCNPAAYGLAAGWCALCLHCSALEASEDPLTDVLTGRLPAAAGSA